MRRVEIASLLWKHVNLRGRYILLPETKNDEPRTVPLSTTALDILRSLPRPEGLDAGQEQVFGLSASKSLAPCSRFAARRGLRICDFMTCAMKPLSLSHDRMEFLFL